METTKIIVIGSSTGGPFALEKILPDIPKEIWDVPVDMIVTESEVINNGFFAQGELVLKIASWFANRLSIPFRSIFWRDTPASLSCLILQC